jgi:hypothetical protein
VTMLPVEQLPTPKATAQEPPMVLCDGCRYPVEADVITKQAIPGGEGETRNVCPDCR